MIEKDPEYLQYINYYVWFINLSDEIKKKVRESHFKKADLWEYDEEEATNHS